jgi:hypothetical protein
MIESERKAAARLTAELGITVTRAAVRYWRSKGYPTHDAVALRHKLRNQERAPKKTADDDDESESDAPANPPDVTAANLEAEIDRIKDLLLSAPDYESARTYKVQLDGLKQAFAIHKDQGHYVTKASQEEAGLKAGQLVKQLILKIPGELPQMLVGLDYPDALKKCEDYAHAILTELATADLDA